MSFGDQFHPEEFVVEGKDDASALETGSCSARSKMLSPLNVVVAMLMLRSSMSSSLSIPVNYDHLSTQIVLVKPPDQPSDRLAGCCPYQAKCTADRPEAGRTEGRDVLEKASVSMLMSCW